jgi:tryptophan-rich sensory protein
MRTQLDWDFRLFVAIAIFIAIGINSLIRPVTEYYRPLVRPRFDPPSPEAP